MIHNIQTITIIKIYAQKANTLALVETETVQTKSLPHETGNKLNTKHI